MRFPKRELDIKAYFDTIKQKLGENDCHIFIDTNVLSQLFKLNGGARSDFFSWVSSCKSRFHIPNWVVMEYSKRAYSQKLDEYVSELKTAKAVSEQLHGLQRFFRGYVDDEELLGTIYHEKKDELLDQLDGLCDQYAKIVNAVVVKKSEHINNVQKEIDEHLKNLVMGTDLYHIIENLYYEKQLRLEQQIPPGFEDKDKTSNNLGDLIIWNEILSYCKSENIKKVIFITSDKKKDTVYTPMVQTISSRTAVADDRIKIAHESLVYEFKLSTGGSEEFYIINFYMLVKMLSDRYNELAFSFQLVSRDIVIAETGDSQKDSDSDKDASVEPIEDTTEKECVEDEHPVPLVYSQEALKDTEFIEYCTNDELKKCIESLKSHNWYTQNDAVDDLQKLLKKEWKETQNNRDAFFVIGRNILQSAEGNAFGAYRFIVNLRDKLSGKPNFIQHAIVDGCLFEVFFDHNGEIRKGDFKSGYYINVLKQTKDLGLEKPFDFINKALKGVKGRYVPVVGDTNIHTFNFSFDKPSNESDHYHTKSLMIDGEDVSDSFSNPIDWPFAEYAELKKKLSLLFCIPEEQIEIEGVPNGIVVYYIKQVNDDPFC